MGPASRFKPLGYVTPNLSISKGTGTQRDITPVFSDTYDSVKEENGSASRTHSYHNKSYITVTYVSVNCLLGHDLTPVLGHDIEGVS